jgi:hypothetical protein
MRVTATAIDVRQAQAEIAAAWQKYQQVEKRGLEFGETVYRWREQFKARGYRKEGDGVCAILHKLGIPRRTAYWWIDRYEVSIGLNAAPTPKELEDEDNSYEPRRPKDNTYEPFDSNWRAEFERYWKPTPEEQKKMDEISREMVEEAARRKAEEEIEARRLLVPSGVLLMASTIIESGYRAVSKQYHPDVGGSHEKMANLNAAVEWLRKQINTVRKVVGWMKGAA